MAKLAHVQKNPKIMDLWTFPLLNFFVLPFLDYDCVFKINNVNLSFKSISSDNLMLYISTKNIAQIFDQQISRILHGKSCHLSTQFTGISQPSDEKGNRRADNFAEYIFPTASIAQNPYCQIPAWYFLSPLDLPWSPWMMPNAPIIVKILGSKHFGQFWWQFEVAKCSDSLISGWKICI